MITYTERHLYLLEKIISDIWTKSELREFFDFLKLVAIVYFRACERNGMRIADKLQSLNDVADDCLLDLFERNAGGFKCWKVYAEQNGLPTLETAYDWFGRIIKKTIRQGLARIFWERDPQKYNVIRLLKLAEKGRKVNYEIKSGQSKFIIHKQDIGKTAMPEHDFSKIYALYVSCSRASNFSTIAERMLDVIEESPVYARIITVSALVRSLRKRCIDELSLQSNCPESNGHYDELKLFVDKTIDSYCNKVSNGRHFKRHDYEKFAPIIKEYFESIISYGRKESLHSIWIRHYGNGIDRNEFHRTIEPGLNFVFKTVKKEVRKFLKESE